MSDLDVQSAVREIRVFLSSTFKDMEHERNYLMSHVFPLVHLRCHERDVVFTEIDLRWGITEESAQNGRTVQICLEEIDRCRAIGLPPFFIGFLGERYGWVPTLQDLSRYWEQQAVSPYAAPIRHALAQGLSVTELEIRFGFLDPMAATAPGRVLMLMRDPALTARLAQPEQARGPVATAAVRAPSFGARLRHLFAAVPAPPAPAALSMPLEGIYYDHRVDGQLARLKDAVREAHQASMTGLVDGYLSVEAFGRAVHDFLMEQLDMLFPAQKTPDAYAQAVAAHRAYAASRLRSYVANPLLTEHVLRWLREGDNSQLTLLQGASGSGKSALLADISKQLAERNDGWVFMHFCGVDGYMAVDHWRDRLLIALRVQGWVTDDVPVQDAARWAVLPLWLDAAQRITGRPMTLVIDAINQLANAESALYKLQSVNWPDGVRVLVSCTPELDVAPVWHIEPMPALDESARQRFVTSYLGNFAKSVSDPLMHALVSASACANPLFLKLVIEESRVHATHENLATRVDELLRHADAGALFLACLEGLDRDFSFYTPQMATLAARLLAASRRGLTHHELAKLLSSSCQTRVPDAVLLPLLANLQPFGEMHEGRLQLMHAILADALQSRHPDVLSIRRQLMAFFGGREPWAMTECAYQLLRIEFADSEQRLQAMWVGHVDEQEVQRNYEGNHFAYLIGKDAERNVRILKNFSDLRVFLKIWELDFQVAYNGLDCIGAGKPWQLTQFQEAMVDNWFDSINSMSGGEVQALRLERLGAWFVETRLYFLAKAFLKRLMGVQQVLLPDDHAARARAASNLADAHYMEGEYGEAEALLLQALEHWRAAGLAHSLPAIPTLTLLAATLRRLEDNARALPLQEEALAIHMEGRTELDRQACTMATPLALLYAALGRFEEARALALAMLEARRRLLGPVHPDVAETLGVLWEIGVREQDMAGAERHLREAVRLLRLTVRAGDPFLASFLAKLAMLVRARGESAEAEELYEEASRNYQGDEQPFDPTALFVLLQLSELQHSRGDVDAAQSSLQQLIVLCDTSDRASHARVFDAARAHVRLGALRAGREEPAEAAEHFGEAFTLLQRIPKTDETTALIAKAQEGMRAPVPQLSFAVSVAGYSAVVQYPVIRYRLLSPIPN